MTKFTYIIILNHVFYAKIFNFTINAKFYCIIINLDLKFSIKN
jgi:hypothetical protein